MLVLNRKIGQRVLLGDEIVITVVKVNGGGVRIGIEAPAEVPILREELLNKFAPMGDSIAGTLEASANGRSSNGEGSQRNRLRTSLSPK
jgi:carbon storage regulator